MANVDGSMGGCISGTLCWGLDWWLSRWIDVVAGLDFPLKAQWVNQWKVMLEAQLVNPLVALLAVQSMNR